MHDLKLVYRDQMVRGVLGIRPAILAKEADTALLESLAQRLAEAEMGMELMRAKGYGQRGQSILDMIKALPEASAAQGYRPIGVADPIRPPPRTP